MNWPWQLWALIAALFIVPILMPNRRWLVGLVVVVVVGATGLLLVMQTQAEGIVLIEVLAAVPFGAGIVVASIVLYVRAMIAMDRRRERQRPD